VYGTVKTGAESQRKNGNGKLSAAHQNGEVKKLRKKDLFA
jgi:hypothetical protein